jgi:hypothetical protein
MPTALAALTTWWRAISSGWLPVGKPMAFTWTVESTTTRSNSLADTAPLLAAVSMVALSNSSTPASPMARRNRPIRVGSHGGLGS